MVEGLGVIRGLVHGRWLHDMVEGLGVIRGG